jgi:hypothetical protein
MLTKAFWEDKMKNDKKNFWILLFILIVPALACKLPFLQDEPEEEAFVLPPGQAMYNNGIVEIMLPDTYQLRDIREDVPLISGALQFFGETTAGISVENLVNEILKNEVMWAINGDVNATGSTRLLILKNKVMANVPLVLISSSIETLFDIPEDQFDTEKLTLGEYDVVRLTLNQKESSEAIYALKDQSLLWLIIFITTPDQMQTQLSEFEASVATFKVISIPLEE